MVPWYQYTYDAVPWPWASCACLMPGARTPRESESAAVAHEMILRYKQEDCLRLHAHLLNLTLYFEKV